MRKNKLTSYANVGGPDHGRPIVGPPMTAAAAPKATRVLTPAQRARRAKRQALGITDTRKLTFGDELLARVSGALPTHADAVANKVAQAKTKKPSRGVPVLGQGPAMAAKKKKALNSSVNY